MKIFQFLVLSVYFIAFLFLHITDNRTKTVGFLKNVKCVVADPATKCILQLNDGAKVMTAESCVLNGVTIKCGNVLVTDDKMAFVKNILVERSQFYFVAEDLDVSYE